MSITTDMNAALDMGIPLFRACVLPTDTGPRYGADQAWQDFEALCMEQFGIRTWVEVCTAIRAAVLDPMSATLPPARTVTRSGRRVSAWADVTLHA